MPLDLAHVPSQPLVLESSLRRSDWNCYRPVHARHALALRRVVSILSPHSQGWRACPSGVRARLGLARIGLAFGVGTTSGI